jgi:hypothetical protein
MEGYKEEKNCIVERENAFFKSSPVDKYHLPQMNSEKVFLGVWCQKSGKATTILMVVFGLVAPKDTETMACLILTTWAMKSDLTIALEAMPDLLLLPDKIKKETVREQSTVKMLD